MADLLPALLLPPLHLHLHLHSYNGAKENGSLRLEGKEYLVQEGDVMLFRFNV